MPRLNRSIARTLEKLKPYDGDEDFMRRLYAKDSPIEGMSCMRIASDISELKDAGMLKVNEFNGRADAFVLTSDGREYRWNRGMEIARAVLKGLIQIASGMGGGLIVWLLTRMFPA